MERYRGKKAVIIGGTSGMGLATAKMLLDGGARVLVTGLSKAGLESAQKEIGKIREKMAGMVPMKRWGTSEEIAKAVLFLGFDATFTTGMELPVDGGWSQL